MKRLKIKSGGEALLLAQDEECPGGAICFLESEWAFTKDLAAKLADDPASLCAFWGTLLERKRTLPGYVIWCDFPWELEETREVVLAPAEEISTFKESVSGRIAGEIIETLARWKAKHVEKPDTGAGE